MVRGRHFWTNFSTILIVDNVDNVERKTVIKLSATMINVEKTHKIKDFELTAYTLM